MAGEASPLEQPVDDLQNAFTRLHTGQPLPLAHLGNHQGRLQHARGQFGLTQTMATVQVLSAQIAKGMTQRATCKSVNDLRKKRGRYSQRPTATILPEGTVRESDS
jgi:hypothetical protein